MRDRIIDTSACYGTTVNERDCVNVDEPIFTMNRATFCPMSFASL